MDDAPRVDETPAQRPSGGDDEALRALFAQYAGRIYDFALRLLRDRDTAALVLQSAFLRVFQSLRLRTATDPALQLYAGAHHDVRERLRQNRGQVLEGEDAFGSADPARLGSAVAAEAPLLGRLSWQAARELRLDDYEALDLSVRQGLSTPEIGAAVNTRSENVQRRLDQALRDHEHAFSGILLLHLGRRACLDLDFLVSDGDWSSSLRRHIGRHLETCETCKRTRARYPSGREVLGALLPVPLPVGWEDTIRDRLLQALHTGVGVPEGAPVVAPIPASPAAGDQSAAEKAAALPAAITPAPAPVVLPPPPAPAPYSEAAGPEPYPDAGSGFLSGGRGPLLIIFGGFVLAAIAIGALCGTLALTGGDEEPEPTATPSASPTITSTTTPSPSTTPTVTSTPPHTRTPEPPTATAVPTQTPGPTETQPPPPPTTTPTPSGGGQSTPDRQGRGPGARD